MLDEGAKERLYAELTDKVSVLPEIVRDDVLHESFAAILAGEAPLDDLLGVVAYFKTRELARQRSLGVRSADRPLDGDESTATMLERIEAPKQTVSMSTVDLPDVEIRMLPGERSRQRELRHMRRELGQRNPALIPHGLVGYTNWMCRCDVCRRASAAWARRARQKRRNG